MSKLKLILGCCLFGGSVGNLSAQNTLVLHLHPSSSREYALEGLKSMTFPTGKISMNPLSSSSELFVLAEVKSALFRFEDPLGLDKEPESASRLRISPNPFTGESLSIQFEGRSNGPVLVELVNTEGQVAHQVSTQSNVGLNELVINTGQLNPGLYLCRIKTGNGTETSKIIKY